MCFKLNVSSFPDSFLWIIFLAFLSNSPNIAAAPKDKIQNTSPERENRSLELYYQNNTCVHRAVEIGTQDFKQEEGWGG